MIKLLSQKIFDIKIKPFTDVIKEKTNGLPAKAQQILDMLSKIVAPLTTTILKKIVQNGYKCELDEASQGFLSILFKNLKDEDGEIKQDVLEKMKTDLSNPEKTKITIGAAERNNYITPILEWIIKNYEDKKDIRSLEDFIEEYKKRPGAVNFQYKETVISKFYDAAIRWLVKYKIESHMKGLQTFLEDNLSELVQKHLEENMKHLSLLLFNRVAELINNISDEEYKNLFDSCALDVHEQMKNLIHAKENVLKSLKDDKTHNPEVQPDQISNELLQINLIQKIKTNPFINLLILQKPYLLHQLI